MQWFDVESFYYIHNYSRESDYFDGKGFPLCFQNLWWLRPFSFSSALPLPSSSLKQTTSAPRRGRGTSAKPKSEKILDNGCFNQPPSFPRSTYKCGIFFKDLSPNVPLAWLEAMPDAVVRACWEEIEESNLKNRTRWELGRRAPLTRTSSSCSVATSMGRAMRITSVGTKRQTPTATIRWTIFTSKSRS